MESFYKLIELINSFGYKFEENKEIFSVKFDPNSQLMQEINYSSLSEMKKNFQGCLNIYISDTNNDEINILDYLKDENDFEVGLNEFKDRIIEYRLILNKDKFVEYKVGTYKRCNIIFFVYKSTLISYLEKDFCILEKDLFHEKEKNIFILFNEKIYIKNNFYMIIDFKKTLENDKLSDYCSEDILDMNNIIDTRNELCNWINGSKYLTPKHIYIDFKDIEFIFDKELSQCICKITTNLIIAYISNFTGEISGRYRSIINGTKRIEIYYDLENIDYEIIYYDKLFLTYQWIYNNSTSDKINICRNVISILVTAKCQGSVYRTILVNSDWLLQSINDNFDIFLRENIQSYFKEKNILIEQIKKDMEEVTNQISDLTKLSNTNIVSLLGTLIAAVVGYIAKGDVSLIKILGVLYIGYLNVNSLFSLPIVIIKGHQSKINFKIRQDIYIKSYNEDNELILLRKNNKTNLITFRIYISATIILIIILNCFIIKAINDPSFIMSILNKLNILIS